MTAPFEPLWTVRDVAKVLSMSISWVYKSAESGELPCLRIGSALRFVPGEIQKYVERLRGGRVLPMRLNT